MVTIAPEQLRGSKGRVIDVRDPDEFAAERLPGAECVPLAQVVNEAVKWNRDEALVVMCKSGMRSTQAAQQLESLGFTDVKMLEGGIEACKKAGVDIVFGKKTIPIVRQVFITAGLVLLSGLGLSLVNPWFLLIDAFVAGGLVFSGATGVCPMAAVLAKMPWNMDTTERPPGAACCPKR